MAGAQDKAMVALPAGAVVVAPGEPIQAALDRLKGSGGVLRLAPGVHTLPEPLRLPSGVTIAGSGLDCEIILDPKGAGEAAIVNAEPDMHDVTLQDLVIEGATTTVVPRDPNSGVGQRRLEYGPIRAGILFQNDGKTSMRNLRLEHITVRNCTSSAVTLFGVERVRIVNCDISASGGRVPPGHGKNHNLKLDHIANVSISGSRFADSMWGHGIAVTFGRDIAVRDCELTRNALDGVRIAEGRGVTVTECLAEGNGGNGIARETWMDPNQGVITGRNLLRNNGGGE